MNGHEDAEQKFTSHASSGRCRLQPKALDYLWTTGQQVCKHISWSQKMYTTEKSIAIEKKNAKSNLGHRQIAN